MALSSDAKMPDASVMACFYHEEGGQLGEVLMAWNSGYDNFVLGDIHLGLENFEVTFEDGSLTCRFTRKAETTIQYEGTDHKFNLENEYHILLAKGSMATIP